MPARFVPKILVPGRGPGRNVPNGVIIGRQPGLSGRGPLQVLDLQQLKGMGLATGRGVQAQLAQSGITFTAAGLLGAGEFLGPAAPWAHDVTFVNGVAGSTIVAQFAATGSAVINIINVVAGVPTVFGTITFAPGALSGTLNFPSLYVVAQGTTVELQFPNPADATLASVSGTIMGFAS